jgi:hypothetical protein
MLLKHNGKIEWYEIPWGKSHLDVIRKHGTILMTIVHG